MPESQYEDLARAALLEITPASTVGDFIDTVDEGDGVVSLLFASAQPGYPDWRWTVSVAHVAGEEPTVLEAELMPAEGALLAPDWLPWSDRLAEYKAAQENAAESPDGDDVDNDDDDDESDESDEDDDESDDDDDSEDDDELDEDDVLGNDVLHGGDLDGVDIDDLDTDDSDEDDADDEESDDDSDDDDEVDRTY